MPPVEKTYLKIPIGHIRILPGRARKDFGRIPELAERIKTVGLMNPLYVTDDKEKGEGRYLLVAGERRYRACMMAGLAEVPVSFHAGLSELEQKVLELEENVGRKDFDWQEEAELHRQIHDLKKQITPGWRVQDTADLAGKSLGHINQAINIAEKLHNNPELKTLIRNLDVASAHKVIKQHEDVQKVNRLQEQGKLSLTSDLLFGNCLNLIRKLPDKSVDLLLTDPPYGLEALEDLREGAGSVMPGMTLMSEHHNSNLPDILKLLTALAPELTRVLKPGAHCYVFCAYQYAGDFIKALHPLEFQPPMLHWDRQKNMSPGFGYNYLSRTECIIMLHNPPRSKRLAENMYCVIEEPQVPKGLRVYPTEKPVMLLKKLICQSTITGDLVLDLFAGSASTLKAARLCGRRGIGFEINEDSYKLAQMHLGVKP